LIRAEREGIRVLSDIREIRTVGGVRVRHKPAQSEDSAR
jgi:hypothetical protein